MIRPARPSDIESILRLSRELYLEDGDVPFDRERALTALRALLDHHAYGLAWVACEGDAPVGYLVLTWGFSLESGGRDAFIDELYVAPGSRGRGLGTALLAAAEAAGRQAGAGALHLAVERSNLGAQRLYRRVGFAGPDRRLLTKPLS